MHESSYIIALAYYKFSLKQFQEKVHLFCFTIGLIAQNIFCLQIYLTLIVLQKSSKNLIFLISETAFLVSWEIFSKKTLFGSILDYF